MKARTSQTATAQERFARRVAAAIEQRRSGSTRLRRGRFSDGNEQRPDDPDKLRRGSFADGYTG